MNRSVPPVAEVEAIAAQEDPALRNLRITACYYELSKALAAATGQTANWCTFATWASYQAGQTIRREDLAATLSDVLDGAEASREEAERVAASALGDPAVGERVAAPALEVSEGAEIVVEKALEERSAIATPDIRASVWRTIRAMPAFGRASDAVARGNRKVFEEIGREFARFLAACVDDPDPDQLAGFCAELSAGEPPAGQRFLQRAFTGYHRALSETDPKKKDQLMLLANLLIGYHEQKRLQPEIEEAMDAPVADSEELKRELKAKIFPRFPGWRSPLDGAYDRLAVKVRVLAREIVTARMMTLALPGGEVLRLGRDLGRDFGPTLRLAADPDLTALLANVDPTPDSVRGSGVEDWANFDDRMHFIADLFRCYQEEPRLFEAPFNAEQAALIAAGTVPNDLGRPAP